LPTDSTCSELKRPAPQAYSVSHPSIPSPLQSGSRIPEFSSSFRWGARARTRPLWSESTITGERISQRCSDAQSWPGTGMISSWVSVESAVTWATLRMADRLTSQMPRLSMSRGKKSLR
jgi:hypothetical protein